MKLTFPLMGLSEPEFRALPPRERVLQVAAWFADKEKVREEGRNWGRWVGAFLRGIGLLRPAPWCAAFVSACFDLAKVPFGPATGRGAVRHWKSWAKREGLLIALESARRGDLFLWVSANGTGHIGFFVRGRSETFDTIEGNTEAKGSRDGDGVYRLVRPRQDHIIGIRVHV